MPQVTAMASGSARPRREEGLSVAKVKQSIEIAAPLPRVFRYVADYEHALEWMAGFDEFAPVDGRSFGMGAKVRAAGRLAGVRVATTLEIVEFVENAHFVSVSDGAVRSTTTWSFAPTPRGTLVSFSGDYHVRGLPLAFLGDQIVRHEVAAHTTLSLRHLKRILESRSAAPSSETTDAGALDGQP